MFQRQPSTREGEIPFESAQSICFTMTDAELIQMTPHTAAKHLLLRRYLDCWFPILGRYNNRINYIGGFSGPGEYADGEKGSPIIAIESAKSHVESGTVSPEVDVNFIFIDRNEAFIHHLESIPGVDGDQDDGSKYGNSMV
jgi:three-Cys-motif partner protein